MFQDFGITADRIILKDETPSLHDHLKLYAEIDVALDPFPFNGATTSCETMWMGVPIVTYAGDHHVSRVGTSQLTNLKLEQLIAETKQEYVEKAVSLATDLDKLEEIRLGMRSRMQSSPLMNAEAFTKNFELKLKEIQSHE